MDSELNVGDTFNFPYSIEEMCYICKKEIVKDDKIYVLVDAEMNIVSMYCSDHTN